MRRIWLVLTGFLLATPELVVADSVGTESEDGLRGLWAYLTRDPPARPVIGRPEYVRSFTDSYGVPCREYRHEVLIAEALVSANAIVCRMPDGSWAMPE